MGRNYKEDEERLCFRVDTEARADISTRTSIALGGRVGFVDERAAKVVSQS